MDSIKDMGTSNFAAVINKNFENQKMPDEIFEKWRKYIYDNTGIYFQDNKKYLLESRLLNRIKFLNLNSYEDYLHYVLYNSGSSSEKRYLYESITITETYFFRNQPRIDALTATVIPGLIKEKVSKGLNQVKIWSAASSSGEEAYSIAMVINDQIKNKFPFINFEITGTDINEAVISTARKGVYKSYSMRNTPPYYIKKYFKVEENQFLITQEIKEKVHFKLLNLYDEQLMKTMFNYDIILCANVLIYFDTCSRVKVINSLYNSLRKGGFLFIGYSETLHNISQAFKVVSFPKTIGYRKE